MCQRDDQYLRLPYIENSLYYWSVPNSINKLMSLLLTQVENRRNYIHFPYPPFLNLCPPKLSMPSIKLSSSNGHNLIGYIKKVLVHLCASHELTLCERQLKPFRATLKYSANNVMILVIWVMFSLLFVFRTSF